MQLGIAAEGIKSVVLKLLAQQVESEKAKFAKLCAENLVHIGYDKNEPGKALHKPAPIKDTSSGDLLDNMLIHAHEQLAHLADDQQCSFAGNVTVHRPNPE